MTLEGNSQRVETNLSGSGGAKQPGSTTRSCERRGRKHRGQDWTLLKLKGPRTEWAGDDEKGDGGIARFVFDTGTHSQLHFDLVDLRRRFMCFGGAQSFGAYTYPFGQVLLDICSVCNMTNLSTLLWQSVRAFFANFSLVFPTTKSSISRSFQFHFRRRLSVYRWWRRLQRTVVS